MAKSRIIIMVLTLLLISACYETSRNIVYAQDPAPDFTLTDVDGNEFTLSDYEGKFIVLEFFGPLCTPCQREVAELKEAWETYGDGLAIISVSEGSLEKTKSFRDKYGIRWVVACDPTLKVFELYHVTVTPTLFLISQEIRIRFKHEGFTEAEVILDELERMGIPEFPSFLIFFLVLVAATVAVAVSARKLRRGEHSEHGEGELG